MARLTPKTSTTKHVLPATVDADRDEHQITRIIAIDGSTVSTAVRNGYPGAEAALMRIAAVCWICKPSEAEIQSGYHVLETSGVWKTAMHWMPFYLGAT